MVYNSGSNGLKTGEKSRFIHQLQLESPFRITETAIENSIDPVPNYPITIEKKGKVAAVLEEFLAKGRRISPTALDQYLHCPLSYYFKYIARFEEEETVSEEVDARMFGTLFHSVMERLYLPYLNATVDDKILGALSENVQLIESELRNSFHELFFKSEGSLESFSLSGRNVLVWEVIRKMVIQTIQVDRRKTPFVLKGLEEKVETTMGIFNGTRSVRIGGVIDRIDWFSGATEIIDYKTGSTEHLFGAVADLFDREAKKRNKAAFQTLVYGSVWDKIHPGTGAIYLSVYGLKKIFSEEGTRLSSREEGLSEINYPEIKERFEPLLVDLLEEIFDPGIPFKQTTVEENCQYCNFSSICGKQSAQS